MNGPPRPRLSVLIITLNEERMLERVLRSVQWADEIVVVDSGSTDRTPEIARRYTEHFHVRPYEGHGLQRARTLELSRGEWLLYVDADEVVTESLRDSILSAVADPAEAVAFRMQLHTWFFGRWIGRRGWRKEWKVRLFHREHGRFDPRPIHEGVLVDGRVDTLKGALLHYPYRDIGHLAEKANRYSTAMADARAASGRGSSAAMAVLRGAGRFIRDYLFGGDFLYGAPGLIRSTANGYYTFLKYAKLWERSRNREGPPHPDQTGATTRTAERVHHPPFRRS
ncbi:MAG: glycosyltransferase family 2 protein [Gemmatimonadota bacterium]